MKYFYLGIIWIQCPHFRWEDS